MLFCIIPCSFQKNSSYLQCLAFDTGDECSPTLPLAFFYAHRLIYSSVPCGALMRPQPVSGARQRGAELFYSLPVFY